MRLSPAAALLALGLGAPARADVTVRYQGTGSGGMILVVSADEAGAARVVIGAGHGGMMMLTRDDVGYVVIDQGSERTVGRQEDMIALAARRHVRSSGEIGREWIQAFAGDGIEIVPTGTERVAGFDGHVYRLTLTHGERRSPPVEIVVSADPRLAPVGRELLRFYDSLRGPLVATAGGEPRPYAAIRALLARGTLLRLGADFRLVEIDLRDVPDSAFAIPGPVLDREQFTAFLTSGPMMGGGTDDLQTFDVAEEPAPAAEDPAAHGPGEGPDPRRSAGGRAAAPGRGRR